MQSVRHYNKLNHRSFRRSCHKLPHEWLTHDQICERLGFRYVKASLTIMVEERDVEQSWRRVDGKLTQLYRLSRAKDGSGNPISTRICLCCRKPFQSAGIHNRMCAGCKGKDNPLG